MIRGLRAYALLFYAFLYGPLLILILFSFNSSRYSVWEGFSLHWYGEVLRNAELREAVSTSMIIGLCSTAMATVIGTLGAYAMWQRQSAWLRSSLYLSLVSPEIITGISLLAFFQWFFRFGHLQLGMHTVIAAHVSFSIVYVVVVVLARLRTYDRALEEAAIDLGATDWQAFRYVTLPFLYPGIGAAALLSFTVSFDDYVITSMVAGVDSQTLPMLIYSMARKGISPTVNAISALITLALGTLILVAQRLTGRTHRDDVQ